jgi:hypothetical protein
VTKRWFGLGVRSSERRSVDPNIKLELVAVEPLRDHPEEIGVDVRGRLLEHGVK